MDRMFVQNQIRRMIKEWEIKGLKLSRVISAFYQNTRI